MTTKSNVFNQILLNIQVMNETLVVIGECLSACAAKLASIEAGANEDFTQLEKDLAAQKAATDKALTDIRKALEALKKK